MYVYMYVCMYVCMYIGIYYMAELVGSVGIMTHSATDQSKVKPRADVFRGAPWKH